MDKPEVSASKTAAELGAIVAVREEAAAAKNNPCPELADVETIPAFVIERRPSSLSKTPLPWVKNTERNFTFFTLRRKKKLS